MVRFIVIHVFAEPTYLKCVAFYMYICRKGRLFHRNRLGDGEGGVLGPLTLDQNVLHLSGCVTKL